MVYTIYHVYTIYTWIASRHTLGAYFMLRIKDTSGHLNKSYDYLKKENDQRKTYIYVSIYICSYT